MTLRTQIEAFPTDSHLLVLTTQGHVYVGRVVEIQDDALRLEVPDGSAEIVLALDDVSGVRAHEEEA